MIEVMKKLTPNNKKILIAAIAARKKKQANRSEGSQLALQAHRSS